MSKIKKLNSIIWNGLKNLPGQAMSLKTHWPSYQATNNSLPYIKNIGVTQNKLSGRLTQAIAK
jgi:hypothetical protein